MRSNTSRAYCILKLALDRVLAAFLMLILAPIFLLLAVIVLFNLGSPVFFRQLRPGLHGRSFMLIKFRTMSDERDENGCLFPDSQRLTAFGRFLRSTSLDELPSLFNILRGDMSFIGPRPLLMQYLPLYTTEQSRRHDVMPGLSGWAQINGRNSISWEQKLTLDIWYVDHQSFCVDLSIILKTFIKVLRREGIGAAGRDTIDPFTGTSTSR